MSLILFGSRAIKYHFPDFDRELKDWDFLVPYRTGKSTLDDVEYKYIKPILDDINAEWHPDKRNIEVLDPDRLLTLKISHLLYDNNWEKHLNDTQFLISKGAKIKYGLFYDLVNWWKVILPPVRRSNLNMDKEQFFKNKINYIIDHDMIHTILNPTPVYTKILRTGHSVKVDPGKFYTLTHENKLELVREEVYVMAWERGRRHNHVEAYQWMLKRFIMHHAPLWEMIFIIQNYKELSVPKFNYIQFINDELYKRGIDYDNDRKRVSQSTQG